MLPAEPDAVYAVPESGPVQLIYRGLPLDEIEDLLPSSAAYRQAGRLLFPEPTRISGRPLISLKSGAIGLLAVGGGLDGSFGSGNDRHISAWQLQKQIDRFEETDEKGTLTIHERERFAHELALVLVTGEDCDFEMTCRRGTDWRTSPPSRTKHEENVRRQSGTPPSQ